MSDKRIKAYMNDPKIQGMMKLQHQREMFQKNLKAQEEQGVQLKDQMDMVYILSTETMADPNIPPLNPPPINTLAFWMRPFFWVFEKFRSWVVEYLRVVMLLRRENKQKLKIKEWKKEAAELYSRFNIDFASAHFSDMTHYCSESAVLEAKQDSQKRKYNQNLEYQWSAVNVSLSLNSLRLLNIPPPLNKNFAQVVFKITSFQTMKVVNKKTKEVIGGITEPQAITDYWGFERNLDKPNSPLVIVTRFKRDEESEKKEFERRERLKAMGQKQAAKSQ